MGFWPPASLCLARTKCRIGLASLAQSDLTGERQVEWILTKLSAVVILIQNLPIKPGGTSLN